MTNMEPQCTKYDEEHEHCGAQNMTIIDNDVRKIMDTAVNKNMKSTEVHKYMRNIDTGKRKYMRNIDTELRT
jgi:hypothetical protein